MPRAALTVSIALKKKEKKEEELSLQNINWNLKYTNSFISITHKTNITWGTLTLSALKIHELWTHSPALLQLFVGEPHSQNSATEFEFYAFESAKQYLIILKLKMWFNLKFEANENNKLRLVVQVQLPKNTCFNHHHLVCELYFKN